MCTHCIFRTEDINTSSTHLTFSFQHKRVWSDPISFSIHTQHKPITGKTKYIQEKTKQTQTNTLHGRHNWERNRNKNTKASQHTVLNWGREKNIHNNHNNLLINQTFVYVRMHVYAAPYKISKTVEQHTLSKQTNRIDRDTAYPDHNFACTVHPHAAMCSKHTSYRV